MRLRKLSSHIVLSMALAVQSLALAAGTYDSGASDKEIKLGISGPESGPAAALSSYLKGFQSYFSAVNADGGIGGRKITVISYDDGYSPPKALEVTKKLVERDEVLAVTGSVGTATSIAVQPYLNQHGVPQLFALAGSSRLNSPSQSPWSSVGIPTYEVEGRLLGQSALRRDPNGRIGILYQDDDAGQSFMQGLIPQLGNKLVAQQSYTVTDATVDSQMINLKTAGATSLLLVTTPKHTALALRRIRALNWSPTIYITSGGSSATAALAPAGPEASKGVIAGFFRKTLSDPEVENDTDVKAYRAAAAKAYPGTDAGQDFMQLGYIVASLTAQVLRQAGDDLTRKNVMRQAASLRDFQAPLLLQGITASTSPTDLAPIKGLKLMQFDGQRYRPIAE